MSDLYRGTILLWSERQAALLRRRAADAGRCDGPHRQMEYLIACGADRWNIAMCTLEVPDRLHDVERGRRLQLRVEASANDDRKSAIVTAKRNASAPGPTTASETPPEIKARSSGLMLGRGRVAAERRLPGTPRQPSGRRTTCYRPEGAWCRAAMECDGGLSVTRRRAGGA
jgi:hypothetical protein